MGMYNPNSKEYLKIISADHQTGEIHFQIFSVEKILKAAGEKNKEMGISPKIFSAPAQTFRVKCPSLKKLIDEGLTEDIKSYPNKSIAENIRTAYYIALKLDNKGYSAWKDVIEEEPTQTDKK